MIDQGMKARDEALKGLAEIHGVESPEVQSHTNGAFYLEEMTTDGTDTVLHLFSLPDAPEPWAPPDGTEMMKGILEAVRDKTSLPVKDKWAELSWEPDGRPEIFHQAIRKMEADVDEWLQKVGIDRRRTDAAELLNKLQDRLFGMKYGFERWKNWYPKRLALAARLRLEPLDQILRTFGHSFEGPPPPDFRYMDNLFQTKQGSWFVRIFDLPRLVLDKRVVIQAFVDELPLPAESTQ